MKNIKYLYIILLTFIGISFLSSCVKEKWEEPEPIVQNVNFSDSAGYNLFKIRDLKQLCLTDTFKIADTILYDIDNDGVKDPVLAKSIFIEGTVISSDEEGNFFKKVIIQDSTAGIEIGIELYSIFTDYPLGQKIAIKCGGLYLGNDNGDVKLGTLYFEDGVWNFGRIQSQEIVDAHFFKMSDGKLIEPKVFKINELAANNKTTLVKLENVQFFWRSVGESFGDVTLNSSGVGHYIEDLAGNRVLLYTSSYSSFADYSIPEGNGTIVGIYGVYGSTKQLYINCYEDVQFTNPRVGPFFIEDFPESVGSFTAYSVKGDDVWTGAFYDDGCVVMDSQGEEDWLISPEIDFSDKSGAILNFRHALNYITTWDDYNLLYSTDYDGISDPSVTGTWTNIDGWKTIQGNSWTFFNSPDLDMSALDGEPKVYFAFKYTSPDNDRGTWEISEFSLKTE